MSGLIYPRPQPAPDPRIIWVRVSPSLLQYRAAGKEKLAEEEVCRMCQRGEPRIVTRHHVVPQSFFKDRSFGLLTWLGRPGAEIERHLLRDCDANCVPLCVQCHIAVEVRDDDSGRRSLRKVLAASEAALAVQLRGQAWFDARYPASLANEHIERLARTLARIEKRQASVERPQLVKAKPKRGPSGLKHRRDCKSGMCVVSCPVWLQHGAAALEFGPDNYGGR